MARQNRSIAKANRNIQNIANGVASNMDALYRSTYMTTPQQSQDLKDLTDRINSNLDKIVNRNMETIGIPSISKLYARLASSSGSKDGNMSAGIDKMFDSGFVTEDLFSMFANNHYLKELDDEIDTICTYMPRLTEALEVQKDCVLSADHFSKDFLNFKNPGTGSDQSLFSERAKDIKRKYELQKLAEDTYMDMAKYGERFIYRVPYSTAIGKLLAAKPNTQQLTNPGAVRNESLISESDNSEFFTLSMDNKNFTIVSESSGVVVSENATVLTESVKTLPSGKEVTEPIYKSVLKENENFKIGIEICKSGIIESAVNEYTKANSTRIRYSSSSMASIHEAESKRKEIQAKGNIDWKPTELDKRFIANDGLIGVQSQDVVKVKAPGCVVKKLERYKVIPSYIDSMCLGYFYFEIRNADYNETFANLKNTVGDSLTNTRVIDSRNAFNVVDAQRQDETLRYIASQLSTFIDKQFVNANQDLSKEIYMILKYNDLFNTPSAEAIKITFIPPEDMVHCYFKLDEDTHRGISDLEGSLIPAKIYTSLYLNSTLGNLTRSQDRRVYYVKQTVDTNIAQTLLNTINQIKKSNFGIRQLQTINSVLNILGRYNDFVIPTNSSGDPPIQFEIMPGQDIETPSDLMDKMEEMAINNTGTPFEVIQARQSVDYAMQLTMSNSKFLRFCYKRQELYETILSSIITPIYNYEYDENVTIDVTLPPPTFLNVTNTNQLVDNTRNFVQSIVEVDLADVNDDKLKALYTKELFKKYIGTHIDVSAHKEILDRCIVEAKRTTDESHSNGGESDY